MEIIPALEAINTSLKFNTMMTGFYCLSVVLVLLAINFAILRLRK